MVNCRTEVVSRDTGNAHYLQLPTGSACVRFTILSSYDQSSWRRCFWFHFWAMPVPFGDANIMRSVSKRTSEEICKDLQYKPAGSKVMVRGLKGLDVYRNW